MEGGETKLPPDQVSATKGPKLCRLPSGKEGGGFSQRNQGEGDVWSEPGVCDHLWRRRRRRPGSDHVRRLVALLSHKVDAVTSDVVCCISFPQQCSTDLLPF